MVSFQNMSEVIFDDTGKKLLFIRILLANIVYLGKYSVIVGNVYSGIYKWINCMNIKVTHKHNFADRVDKLCQAKYEDKTYYVVALNKGRIAVLNAELVPLCLFEPEDITEIQSISIHPCSPFFVVVGNDTVCTYNLDGKLIEKNRDNIVDVRHSFDGKLLWCIKRNNSKEFTIEIREADNFTRVLAKKVCENELYDSEFSLGLLPESNKVYLLLAAGQDGSLIGFAEFENENITFTYPESLNIGSEPVSPIWGENEHEFLLQQYTTGIFKYEYPSCKLLQEYYFPEETEYIGCSHAYLNKEEAIIQREEQFWLLNLNTMKEEGSCYIEGHEPKETKYFYPLLADDTSMMTDIYYLERFGNDLIGFAGIKDIYSIFLLQDCGKENVK